MLLWYNNRNVERSIDGGTNADITVLVAVAHDYEPPFSSLITVLFRPLVACGKIY